MIIRKLGERDRGDYSISENLLVDKINFCTAMVIVVLVLLNSGLSVLIPITSISYCFCFVLFKNCGM